MDDNFKQDIFKAIDKIRTKHKQPANVESIFEQIIKTTGNESISKAFPEDRTETLITDDMLENKPRLEKNSYYLTEKSKQLLLNVHGDITEPLIQSQDTPTEYFTANKTENSRKEFLAFKKYIMEELNNLKNRLKVVNSLGNASNSHETTAILKEEIDFLQEDNKNKSITIQNLLEKENLLFRNKDERNIQYNVDVNNHKSNFPPNKTFKLSQNLRNNKETNNIKLKHSWHYPSCKKIY